MKTIVHKIRLKDIALYHEFRDWVVHTDYLACQQLDSVLAFEVIDVTQSADAQFHLIEIIRVSDLEAFDRDMQTPVFQSLVARFEQMADVIEEISGERIGNGYQQ
ncbi:RedY [Vibrio spartinae]|uniref:PigK n=1 Tax=Vibrio spartinae TaxID=1918945 RepID=A0A1N6M397_9VIBR|nr:RedY [Vibrio spartinae]QMV14434.1 PigK [Vibrio spartinae]SIO93912.1 REDY-like protein HapK [Vibrio spartinae]